MREGNGQEAAWCWGVLGKAYPEHPSPLFNSVNAYIEAGELELTRARQDFPNHPHSLIDTALLARRRKEWGRFWRQYTYFLIIGHYTIHK